jgi:quinolinate synthase
VGRKGDPSAAMTDVARPDLDPELDLFAEIDRLRKEMHAVILAHYYQEPDIQDIADFVGDSLGLSRRAAATDAEVIVFAGVHFMAETAKILNPSARVLIPRQDAGCPMADMVTREDVAALKRKYPGAMVCSYVNTNADVKAESDICCTSANAVDVVGGLGAERVIFTPDRNLAAYVSRKVATEVIPFNGYCYVHARFTPEDIRAARLAHPGAPVVAHPECNPEVLDLADEVRSTSGMVKYARESAAREFIVATEEGLLERMAREMPDKRFYSPGKARVCFNMKKTRLDDVLRSLVDEVYEVTVDPEVAAGARKSLERMIALGP